MPVTKERAHRDEFSGTLKYHIRGLTGSRKLGASTTSSSNAPSASLSQNIQLYRGNIGVILG